jgi:hypothetical protein
VAELYGARTITERHRHRYESITPTGQTSKRRAWCFQEPHPMTALLSLSNSEECTRFMSRRRLTPSFAPGRIAHTPCLRDWSRLLWSATTPQRCLRSPIRPGCLLASSLKTSTSRFRCSSAPRRCIGGNLEHRFSRHLRLQRRCVEPGLRRPHRCCCRCCPQRKDEMMMIRQYRHAIRSLSNWEIPAGLLDIPGEDPLVCGKRELARGS